MEKHTRDHVELAYSLAVVETHVDRDEAKAILNEWKSACNDGEILTLHELKGTCLNTEYINKFRHLRGLNGKT